MEKKGINIQKFLAISAVLTGYDAASLTSTGMLHDYANSLDSGIGRANAKQFLDAATAVLQNPLNTGKTLEKAVLEQLMTHYKYGAICKNIIQMWYTGTWFAMQPQWQALYGDPSASQQTVTVSAKAYQEGLIWDTIEAHPPGAKQPGFGSWEYDPSKLIKK